MPTSKDLNDLDSQLKKSLISPESFKRGLSMDPSKNIIGVHKTVGTLARHTRKLVIRVNNLEKTVNNQAKKITSLKNISKNQSTRISGANIGAKLPGGKANDVNENIKAITNSLTSIAQILAGGKKLKSDTAAFDRRKAEQEKRALAESKLEKRFDGLKKIAEKIIAPVKNILDRIIDFLVKVFLGRVIFKLIEWFGDPKNASKVKSIIRFIGDFWPALLSAYILFGTSFGGLIRFTLGWVARLSLQIGRVAIPALLRLVAANPVASLVIGGAAAAGVGAYAASRQNEQKREGVKPGEGTPDASQLQREQTLQRGLGGMFAGGGFVIPKFFGGGANAGYISGEKGVDKVPAMLTDGEFVMSAGAVQTWGLDTLEAMNAAGGGTNKPKVIRGTTFAQGGGSIGGIGDARKGLIDVYNWFNSQGIDLQNPKTWSGTGGKFAAGVMSGLNKGANQLGNFGMSQLRGASQLGLNLANQTYRSINDPRLQQNLVNYGQRKLNEITSSGPKILAGIKNKAISMVDSPLAALEKYGTERENALIKSGELKPGAALTKTAQANLDKSDAYIKSLYDPKKDKGPVGFAKKAFQDVQNKGLLADPFAMLGLKEEGTEKFVEKISGGRVKNLGAKITGLQYALKGLAGPLGKAFRIDDRGSLGRYVRPAMLEAQRRGQGGVGAVGLGQTDYNKLMGDKLANLALGQFNFKVDKKGRATTDDTYEANKPASEYFKGARSALKSGDIGGALFKGVSGVLRINQNTGWGNIRPGGIGIDLGGGFTPTDDKGKPIPPTKAKSSTVTMYGPNDPRRKSASYQSRFARPKNAGVKPVAPPVKPKPKVTVIRKPKGNVRGGGSGGGNGSQVPNIPMPKPSSAKAAVQGRNVRGGR